MTATTIKKRDRGTGDNHRVSSIQGVGSLGKNPSPTYLSRREVYNFTEGI
jgi:hypothetical protein